MPAELILLGDAASWKETVGRTASVLSAGGVAVLPAEGLYGYHARADRAEPLARLRALKPREEERGFILLIAEPGDLSLWVAGIPPRAQELIRAHWPGALTLVLPAAPGVRPEVGGSRGSVAVRCPGSDFLRAVIRATGVAIVSTSANAPGGPPPARVADAPAEGVDLVVDGGALSGVPSTLVRVEGDEVRVLRHGAVRIAASRP